MKANSSTVERTNVSSYGDGSGDSVGYGFGYGDGGSFGYGDGNGNGFSNDNSGGRSFVNHEGVYQLAIVADMGLDVTAIDLLLGPVND